MNSDSNSESQNRERQPAYRGGERERVDQPPIGRKPGSPPQPAAWRSFCGVWQLTYPRLLTLNRLLLLAGLLLVAGVVAHALIPNDVTGLVARGRYLSVVVAVFVCILAPAFAFLSAAGSMRDDMSGRTVDYVLTRPVRRSRFVVFKYLAQLPQIQLQALLALGVALAIGVLGGVPGLAEAAVPLMLVQVLVVFAFAALGLLCAVLTSRYVVVGLIYAVIVEIGVGRIPTQLNRLSLTQQARELLAGLKYAGVPEVTTSAGTSVGIILALAVVWTAVAALIFAFRELSAAEEV